MDLHDLQPFLDVDGKLLSWPAKLKKQLLALLYLSEKLAWDRVYTEKQMNDVLNEHHLFADPALLRRELFMKRFIDREADGSRYWKTVRQLASEWDTKRLFIRNAKQEDLGELQAVYDECAYIGEWSGFDDQREQPMRAELRHETLPSKGKKELHRVQSILLKDSGDLVGYLTLYHGFPDRETFWIAVLAIRPARQKQKLGQEVMEQLEKEVDSLGSFTGIGCSVSIKNWPALRFWIKNGFTEILHFEGDGTCSEKTFADLWLRKAL